MTMTSKNGRGVSVWDEEEAPGMNTAISENFLNLQFSACDLKKTGIGLLTADQSRLPILKERRTLKDNINLVENKCQ